MKTVKEPLIFCVDDDRLYLELIKAELEAAGYTNVRCFSNENELTSNLYVNPDIVLLDYHLEDDTTGMDLLKKIKSFNPDIQVIMLSGQEKLEVAVNSLKFGAYDYVIKNDVALNRIGTLVNRICQWNDMLKKNSQVRKVEKLIYVGLALVVTSVITFSLI